MSIWDDVASSIKVATHRPFTVGKFSAIGGGSINKAYRVEGTDGTNYFLKINESRHYPMLVAETAGLKAISATSTLRVPKPLVDGVSGEKCYLVLEYLELSTNGNGKLLGEQLAGLHHNQSNRFGFTQDNFIGTTPQPNTWKDNWIDFWRENRLGFQLSLAAQNGFGAQLQSLGEKLMDLLPVFFADYTPQPSLLHGDLWSGNHAFLLDGIPTTFDPAVYYGDRECDIAMTELFGGYSADFYSAYRAFYPMDAGYAARKNLYNLYHILNHANLFGGGYARQSEQMMQRLLAET